MKTPRRKLRNARILAATLYIAPRFLFAQPEVEIEFIGSFGSSGTAAGQFNSIGGLTVDNTGQIYITDNDNHRIQICDYQGNCGAEGSSGSNPGQFMFPIGITIDEDGRVVVSDGRNFRIQIRDGPGSWRTFGSNGILPGQFRIPGGLAVDDQNRIVIADENNGRVQACDHQGNCSVVASGFVTPRSVGIDSQNRLVISDRETNRIYTCVPNGSCINFGSRGTATGQFRAPTELWVDDEDRIFITDRDNDRLQICDPGGACVAFGERGSGQGRFNGPTAIAVDNQDRIIVGDSGNDRIQIFQASYPTSQTEDFTVGGTVSGLVGSGLVLQNNGGDDLPIASDGAFTFAAPLADGSSYSVTVLSQPVEPAQTCKVANAHGSLHGANVSDVSVTCLLDATFRINAGISDAWFSPATNGQGFLIVVFPEIQQVFLAWFTFDIVRPADDVPATLGEAGHRWLTAQGPYSGNTASLSVFVTQGGVFNAAEPPATNDGIADGTLTIEFADCTEGLVSYELFSPSTAGEIPIQRIVDDKVALCETLSMQ